jgi:PucR C-terminal helix-turn-helix domain/GGDEF-like domain
MARIRISAIGDSSEVADPSYLQGLHSAVTAALDYGLSTIEHGEERFPPVPVVLLAQARMAARSGISLDTVLRRYAAGYALLRDVLIEEAERGPLDGRALKCLLRSQATLFDAVLAAVSEEYGREAQSRMNSITERRAECVERLLAGELLDTSELQYDLGVHHTGAIAAGQGAGEAIRDLAKVLDRRLLLVCRSEGIAWAWLGARRALDAKELERHLSQNWPTHLSLAIGESGQGLAGWCLTHQQARAALPIAVRSPRPFVRYADVALLASILQDDLLATSLREMYLVPLECGPDGGEVARETLRAYFAAERNLSSAAVVLEVSRRTVANRLRVIETKLNRPLGSATAEIEAALRLQSFDSMSVTSRNVPGGG